jgi:4,5-dihydroxyphthalate decarboxylase
MVHFLGWGRDPMGVVRENAPAEKSALRRWDGISRGEFKVTSQIAQAVIERQNVRPDLLPVSMAVADYDRTRPVINGEVKAAGLALKVDAHYVGDFCVEPVYERYDVAEMSFSWYVTARSNGEPVIALPVFPLRMPVLAYVFVRADSPISDVRQLIGAQIGVPSYRYTVNLWLRGIFEDRYGVSPGQIKWVTCEPEEGAGFVVPPDIDIHVANGANVENLLNRGEVDAIFVPRVPQSYIEGTSNMRRLFRDTQAEVQAYSRETGIVPITHTVVMKQSLAEQEPWVCESLVRAFMEAQRRCNAPCLFDPKLVSMPDAIFYQEQNRAAYGRDPWAHGVPKNRSNIETFLRYAHDQGYTARSLTVDELFPANTLALQS